MFRRRDSTLEVLLVHPGGPFFARKDEGSWTIPKGLIDEAEPELAAAKREFEEETSIPVLSTVFLSLGEIRQKGGKIVSAWAFEGDCEADAVCSNTFEMEWPPKSGKMNVFPEIDRADWFDLETAARKIMPAQRSFLERLAEEVF